MIFYRLTMVGIAVALLYPTAYAMTPEEEAKARCLKVIAAAAGAVPVPAESRAESAERTRALESANRLRAVGYRKIRVLGVGVEGVVMQATSPESEGAVRVVVIKDSHTPDRPALTTEEARLLRLVTDHEGSLASVKAGASPRYFLEPKVVRIGDRNMLEMEFFPRAADSLEPAPTLYRRLRDGKLTYNQKIEILQKVGWALLRSHEAGVIHRDVKTMNILVDDGGNIKLVDFGLAAERGGYPHALASETSGTPENMSPNQWRKGVASRRDDMFGLRRVALDLFFTGNAAAKAHRFQRLVYEGGKPREVIDFAHFPEDVVLNPHFGAALGARWPGHIEQYLQLVAMASKSKVGSSYDAAKIDAFYDHYFLGLATLKGKSYRTDGPEFAVDTAMNIMESKELIARFPRQLSVQKRDAVIRAFFKMDLDTHPAPGEPPFIVGALGPHPFLYYAEFRVRLKELQAADLAHPDEFYLAEARNPTGRPR